MTVTFHRVSCLWETGQNRPMLRSGRLLASEFARAPGHGKKLVPILGHETVPASSSSGVNALTGEGLAEALAGAGVVVDVTNSPSFADAAVLEFFEASTRNLLAAGVPAGVGHHVALSVVGADRLPDGGYMRAKVAQERLITASELPYSIVRASQFFEFLGEIAGPRAEATSSACRRHRCSPWRQTMWPPHWPKSSWGRR